MNENEYMRHSNQDIENLIHIFNLLPIRLRTIEPLTCKLVTYFAVFENKMTSYI